MTSAERPQRRRRPAAARAAEPTTNRKRRTKRPPSGASGPAADAAERDVPPVDPNPAVGSEPGPAASATAENRASEAADTETRPGFAETTSRIVRQAASILEEEIAAGVIAAKEVEKRFIDVDSLRGGDPGEVIQRFRRDTHEVVDIFLDLAHAATRSLGDVAGRAVRFRPMNMPGPRGGTPAANAPASSGAVPTLVVPTPVAPGGSSEVLLSVENDTESPTVTFELHTTDLVDQDGNRIAAEHVSFSARTLSVGPHETEKVAIRVSAPSGTPPGRYSGLIQASRMDQLRAILIVDIG
jgi:hypothetical protein